MVPGPHTTFPALAHCLVYSPYHTTSLLCLLLPTLRDLDNPWNPSQSPADVRVHRRTRPAKRTRISGCSCIHPGTHSCNKWSGGCTYQHRGRSKSMCSMDPTSRIPKAGYSVISHWSGLTFQPLKQATQLCSRREEVKLTEKCEKQLLQAITLPSAPSRHHFFPPPCFHLLVPSCRRRTRWLAPTSW